MPSVRARHLKTKLEVFARAPGGALVLARLGAGPIADIERAHGLDWLPISLDLATTRAVHEALGVDGAHELWTGFLAYATTAPLFAAVARAGLALIDRGAMTWGDLVRKSWPLAFRECGRWTVEGGGASGLRLALFDLPPECAADDAWLASVGAVLGAIQRLREADGRVTLAERDAGAGVAVFRAERRAPP